MSLRAAAEGADIGAGKDRDNYAPHKENENEEAIAGFH
jgi:hypothetical protein